jgi:thiosulfate dehydrogenase [quinone] large subunit
LNNDSGGNALSWGQQIGLVLLRTLIGWHFLYEGYYKLVLPAWSADGQPIADWSSAGYINAATGPLAGLFRRMIEAGWGPWIDRTVEISLILVGLSLILGLFTKLGCIGALLLLALFYVSAMPMAGIPQRGAEGTYLLVNKNLIEACAVLVLMSFNTGRIAGLDLLLFMRRAKRMQLSDA